VCVRVCVEAGGGWWCDGVVVGRKGWEGWEVEAVVVVLVAVAAQGRGVG
jgi:hypothetical protein